MKDSFDSALLEKYDQRIRPAFVNLSFVPDLNDSNEDSYNNRFYVPPHEFCLHKIKVDYVELCDALYFDSMLKKAYFIHVKDGLGASIRDLTSQVHMSARIIEEETLTQNKNRLKRLYQSAVNSKRIDIDTISEPLFIRQICSSDREYVMVLHSNKMSMVDIKTGYFRSRIARFSLIELSAVMNANNWAFSLTVAENTKTATDASDTSAA